MRMVARWMAGIYVVGLVSCSAPPTPDPALPGGDCFCYVAARRAAVVISDKPLHRWTTVIRALQDAPDDADGGSATPVSADGYFLTADHVLANAAGRHVKIVYGGPQTTSAAEARVIWRSSGDDLAILHAPFATPLYYSWTSPSQWIPAGTPLVHGGVITGMKHQIGTLVAPLAPESRFVRARRFQHSIPLKPGDSGGAVVDAKGRLIGINSAVEFLMPLETAFFIGSEGNRPNTKLISDLIEKDRAATIPAARP